MKNLAGTRLKALGATNKVKTKASLFIKKPAKHQAPAAPLVPRGEPTPASLVQRRENQNLNQVSTHLPSQQFSDDPYAFHPSEYTEHASPENEVEEELENEENLFANALPSPEESDEEEEEDNEEEESGEEDFEAVSEEEVAVAVQGDDSESEWEPSSESDDPEEVEDVPAAAAAEKKQGATMVKQNKTATAATKTFSRKSNLVSGPDSSFGIYLSDRMTNTANTGGAATSKATNQHQQQQKQKQVLEPATVPSAAPAISAPPTAPAAVTKIKNKKKKRTFADQAALPLMIPKSVAREPAGTAILIELPPGVELAGASGVVGRILKSSGRDGASGSRDASHSSGIVLDLMGIQYSTEVVQLSTSLAVAHLTGDRLIVDSILSTAVRAAAVPGQLEAISSAIGNESIYSMEFDSDESDYEDDTFDNAAITGSKKKGKGGAVGKKGALRAKAGGGGGGARGVKKPRKTVKKKGNASSKRSAKTKK